MYKANLRFLPQKGFEMCRKPDDKSRQVERLVKRFPDYKLDCENFNDKAQWEKIGISS